MDKLSSSSKEQIIMNKKIESIILFLLTSINESFLEIVLTNISFEKSILSILLVISTLSYSQNRRLKHITSRIGISQSEIYCFLEDSQGFLWFGTVDGLNRYDGNNITIFNTDRNSINCYLTTSLEV